MKRLNTVATPLSMPQLSHLSMTQFSHLSMLGLSRLSRLLLPLLMLSLLLLPLTGCGTQTEPDEPSPVYTDWSKLTPYEPAQPVYTHHAGYNANGTLEARDDYGALLPYIGKYSAMENYVIGALPFYGLVTSEGELVSDPVYVRIDFHEDFLVLYRGDPMGTGGGDAYAGGTFFRTLAAADGRWVHELTDSYYVGSGSGLLMTSSSDGSLDLWNTDGEVVTHFDSSIFTPWLGEHFTWGEEGGPFINWIDDRVGYVVSNSFNGEYRDRGLRLYLDFTDGTVTDTPPEGYDRELDYEKIAGDTPKPPVVEGCSNLDPVVDQVTGKTYFYGLCRSVKKKAADDAAGEAADDDGDYDAEDNWEYALFDSEGRLLAEKCKPMNMDAPIIVRAGLCSTVEDGSFCFRSLADSTLVFCYPMRSNSD